MKLEGHIAWRYLFSKKGHNAINIVSGVSAAAVAVVTAAMVCVLSVMNGFGALVEHMFSEFDAELIVTPAEGKTLRTDTLPIQSLYTMPELSAVSRQIEETALVRYKDHQLPARVLGVDSLFAQTAHIDSIITDGFYCVYDGAWDRAVLGRGLAAQVGINAHFTGALHLYAPERTARINMLRPDKALLHEYAYIAGTFAVNQIEYDDQLMLVSIDLAQRLFCYDEHTATALRLKTADGVNIRSLKRQLREQLGAGYKVSDRYEQQADFFRILRIEKLLTILLLVFILLIASFNIIGSLSMLIIDKREDIRILSDLGADTATIRRTFLLEGWLISSLGALIGLITGVLLCLGQQYFGWLKLGSGEDYIIQSYPVLVQWTDILLVAVIVLALGLVAAWYPSRKMKVICLAALCVCTISCTTSPSGRIGIPAEYTSAYQEVYGQCYDSIPHAVVALDLYSEGLSLNAEHRMQGTGYNLYVSDIFLPDRIGEDSLLLAAGTYRSDTTAEPYTFLPGKAYETTPTGIYLLYIEEGRLQHIQLIDSGMIIVRDTTEALQDLQMTFYFRNTYGERAVYNTHFQGILQPFRP